MDMQWDLVKYWKKTVRNEQVKEILTKPNNIEQEKWQIMWYRYMVRMNEEKLPEAV